MYLLHSHNKQRKNTKTTKITFYFNFIFSLFVKLPNGCLVQRPIVYRPNKKKKQHKLTRKQQQ